MKWNPGGASGSGSMETSGILLSVPSGGTAWAAGLALAFVPATAAVAAGLAFVEPPLSILPFLGTLGLVVVLPMAATGVLAKRLATGVWPGSGC